MADRIASASIREQLRAKGVEMKVEAPTGKKLTSFGFPKLAKLGIVDLQAAKEARDRVNAHLNGVQTWLTENINAITGLLDAQSDEYQLAVQSIEEFRGAIVEQVNAMPTDPDKETLRLMVMNAVLGFPQNSRALNLITDIGAAIGYLVPATEEDLKRSRAVKLPVSDENGRWHSTALTSHGRDSHKVLNALRERSYQSRNARIEAQKAAAAELGKGAGDFLGVYKAGEGEAVLEVPSEKRGDRILSGGTVRVRLEKGKIYAAGAVGGCAGIFQRISDEKVFVPVSFLGAGRPDFRNIQEEERRKLTSIFHSILRRGAIRAKEVAEAKTEREAIKAQATPGLSGADVVLRRTAGKVVIFSRKPWVTGQGPSTKEYQRPYFLLEVTAEGQFRVAACPKRLEELFANCREFAAPGEKFSGLAYPLSQMLRTLYGVFERTERRKAAGEAEAAIKAELEEHFLVADSEESGTEPPATHETTEIEESGS